jgi:hypothetical protein
MGHKAGIGAIFGVVSEEGVAKPNSPVVLLDRENRKIVRRQLTREDGGFTFNGLNENEATYMAFVTDEDGAVPKNALIQDRILPVPAYAGATFWGNWQNLARRDGAAFMWEGANQPNGAAGVIPYDARCSQRSGSRWGGRAFGVVSMAEESTVPGAPHIPVLNYVSGRSYLGGPPNTFAGNSTGAQSLEIVLDLLNSTAVTVGAVPSFRFYVNSNLRFFTWHNDSFGESQLGPAFRSQLRWVPASRTLTVRYRHGVGEHWHFNWDTGINAGTLVSRSYVFPEGEVPTGLVHVAYVFIPGTSLKLFVNGIAVSTWSLAAESPSLPTYNLSVASGSGSGWTLGAFIVSGAAAATPSNITNAFVGPYAFYYRALTDADILAHSNALVDATVLPNVTGYVKEVIMDSPAIYARLDDLQEDINAGFRLNHQIEYNREAAGRGNSWRFQQINPSLITVEQSSPVIGGMATAFSGGFLQCGSMARSTIQDSQYAVEFFIRPSQAPVSGEQVFRIVDPSTPMVWVNMNADRSLTIGHRLGNSTNESLAFATPLPFDDDTHVVIAVDKDATAAYLYLNGVLDQTLQTNATLLMGSAGSETTFTDASAFAYIAGSASGTSTFKGMLCEVAFYGRVLPAARVEAHYNARLIP